MDISLTIVSLHGEGNIYMNIPLYNRVYLFIYFSMYDKLNSSKGIFNMQYHNDYCNIAVYVVSNY